MPGAQLTASPLASSTTAARSVLMPLWKRSLVLDGLVVRRLAALMLTAGALLAWSPIHPGLLCPLRASTGVPCPMCGMTTSVRACLNLDLGAAMAANPGGIAALVLAVGVVAARPRRVAVPWLVAGAALGVMWVWQLFRFSVL